MSILNINDLALQLVALDFSDEHSPNNVGPTKTSRALAIIHLAAHDAYAQVTKKFKPRLEDIPARPSTLDTSEATGSTALLCAGFRAATLLYPDFKEFIDTTAANFFNPNDGDCCSNLACKYGEQIADAWIAHRMNDGSSAPQLDTLYNQAAGRHRPDPLRPQQQTLGRNWGLVNPFVLSSVFTDAFLKAPPPLDCPEYATAFNEVKRDGKNDLPQKAPDKAVIGIFWGYDGANKIGVPPRLYNQVIRAIEDFQKLEHDRQIKILTAINVAMADAGIASWYWKYLYDVWRPVVGIREADAGWGPKGQGDKNPATTGDPFWLPLGAPNSNPINQPASNGTPNFPAYPSGHATFGAACFETAAALMGKTPEEINVKFVSDEFDGVTTDNTGAVRPKYEANFSLRKAIMDNNQSRIYLGVHWQFDATGGEEVGKAIAIKVAEAFK
ncbi:vanadium-dependent haloperoxidase [Chamaesiphon minutus]|uniref:PAP2 superfamily protein n=1 Tax=Chamaesiphon minutus (strain ATCC 27169 / PCC 6605) TaxID=1173020 RepID=K9UG62_CHAP6|nr:vanadium-dependent haloperoxidase [Chamaesiphon minutus]AFY93406.1 PAP2 superfamily protein [Chamaesiphon minutus PCC 6605]